MCFQGRKKQGPGWTGFCILSRLHYASEKEFQIDGAAKEKERRPLADQIIEVSQAGTESRAEDRVARLVAESELLKEL